MASELMSDPPPHASMKSSEFWRRIMFEILYKDPATIERYRGASLLEERERYLYAVLASGVVGEVARRVARTQLALMELLNLPDADVPIGLATVEAAVQEWCRNDPAVSAAGFRRHAFRWLRFLGWLEEPVRDVHPHARQVEAFAAWMRDYRGLSEATIGNCRYESDRLFAWAAGRNLMLADMTIGDVDQFLAARIAEGALRRTSARAVAGCLRSFFRFAQARNWCRAGIAECASCRRWSIPTDRFPRGSIGTKSRGCSRRQRVRPRQTFATVRC